MRLDYARAMRLVGYLALSDSRLRRPSSQCVMTSFKGRIEVIERGMGRGPDGELSTQKFFDVGAIFVETEMGNILSETVARWGHSGMGLCGRDSTNEAG